MPFSLYALALAVFVMGTSEFMLAGLLPEIAEDFNISLGTAGLLTTAFAVGMVVGAPLMAAFARRWPPRLTLLVCLFVFAGCHMIGALTPSFSVLLVMRVLSALANAGFLAVALGAATMLVPQNRKGRALAILLSGTTIATVFGVPAGAMIGTEMGWRATFWAIAILCIPAMIGVLVGIRRIAETESGLPDLRTEIAQLGSRRLVATMCLGAMINGGTFAALTYLSPIITDTAGLGAAWISIALVAFGIGSFFGVTLAGRLSDQQPGTALAVGGPLLLLGWIALALSASSPGVLIVLVFTQGVLSFGVGSILIARVLYASAGAPTMGGAYATAALNIGAAIGPLLGALGLAVGATPIAPIWVAAGLTAVALATMLVVRRDVVSIPANSQR